MREAMENIEILALTYGKNYKLTTHYFSEEEAAVV